MEEAQKTPSVYRGTCDVRPIAKNANEEGSATF